MKWLQTDGTGRMFSKLMDVLSEEVADEEIVSFFIDDVVSCVEGVDAHNHILKRIDKFAKDHKLKWGNSKCKVMPIGKHIKINEWQFGEDTIQNSDK